MANHTRLADADVDGGLRIGKTYDASLFEALYMQIMSVHPFSAPVWLAGLWFLFWDQNGKNYRARVGAVFLVTLPPLCRPSSTDGPVHCAVLPPGHALLRSSSGKEAGAG